MLRLFCAISAVVAALLGLTPSASAATPTTFADEFTEPAPLGSFSDCNHSAATPQAVCVGLAGRYRSDWWAYPTGWPDTATQRGYPVVGVYDPAGTTWVSGGQLHVRLFRSASGPVHSAALVPKPLMGGLYGTYEERFRVSHVAPGYKSAHLLWPSGDSNCPGCEIDFPEQEWTGDVHAYTHPRDGDRQDAHDTDQSWSEWHTSRIEWTPIAIRYYLDGRLIGTSTQGVPDQPMTWILQNEAALNGDQAAPNSWAQLDIDWVRGTTAR